MTGIERLRKLSEDMLNLSLWARLATGTEKDWDCYKGDGRTLNDELLSIANQIEAEQDVETVRSDAMRAWEWVREHGGLDEVRRRWGCLSYYADPVPRSCMERRLARLQRQIDESHAALRRRNQRIAVLASEINRAHNENHMEFMRRAGNYTAFADEVCKRLAPQLRYVEGCTKDVMDAALEALDRRLMPEGMEWMLWDDGKPVTYDDAPDDVIGVYLALDGSGYALMTDLPDQLMSEPSERVKRPAVPASDGEPLEVGQTVWDTNGDELVIGALEDGGHTVACRYVDVGDGIPVHGMWSPSDLTHQRPDTWQRIEEDAGCTATKYNERRGTIFTTKQQVARDLVRRCRALAERERGE